MYRLFNKPIVNRGEICSPNMARLRNIIYSHSEYQQNIYREHGIYVPSNHIFIKLLYMLASYIQVSDNIERVITDNITEICSALKITSSYTKGAIRSKVLYTTKCAILSTTFNDGGTDWRLLRPIRCLNHPFTSLESYTPPIGKKIVNEGFSVLGIDLVMLGIQFNQWMLYNNAKPDIEKESIPQYVSKFILPNMLPEQMDIALRNRLLAISKNESINNLRTDRSYVKAYQRDIDIEIHRVLAKINTRSIPYWSSLNQVPMIYSQTFITAIPKEIDELSTYSYWLILLAYIDWVYIGLSIVELDHRSTNGLKIILKRIDRFIDTTKVLNIIPEYLQEYFNTRYDLVKTLIL